MNTISHLAESDICGSKIAHIRSVSENRIALVLDEPPAGSETFPRFVLRCCFDGSTVYPEAVQSAPDQYTLDLTLLKEKAEFRNTINYEILAAFDASGSTGYFRLCALPEENPAKNTERDLLFLEDIYFPDEYSVIPDEYIGRVTSNADLTFLLSLCTRNKLLKKTHHGSLHRLNMSGGILRICFDLKTDSWEYARTVFSFRCKHPDDAAVYEFRTAKKRSRGDSLRIDAELDLNSIQCKSLYWDVFVILRDPSGSKEARIPVLMDSFQRIRQKFLYNGSYRTENGFILYPYYTGSRQLAFVYRQKSPYDGMDIIFKEFLAVLLYRIAKPWWKKQHICLVCEKFSSMAQDNGYYFFKHCMEAGEEKNLNKKIFYIITADSPDRDRVSVYGNHVVNFMSLRHMIYTLAADLIVGSDSRYHSYALQSRHSIFNRYLKNIPFVFLQHGVTALKRVDAFYGKGKKSGCDLFIVCSEKEKQIITEHFGYGPDEVAVTGFARWDVLKDCSGNGREILIMPTWRNWLDSVPDETFENSDYFRNYMGLLNSGRFARILEKYDLQVNFYLHAKFQEYVKAFQALSPRIHLISFGEIAVNEMLMRCRMLITDYSSVSWDMLYQNKPTLFYQFDLDKYEEAQGSYLDMRTELFGDRAETLEDLLNRLEEQVQADFVMKPEYAQQQREYFSFSDHEHSRQICEAIKKM